MSREYSVLSRYKNPDRFIARLKHEVTLEKENTKYWISEYNRISIEFDDLRKNIFGELWFCYKADVTHSVSFIHDPLEKSQRGSVGDEVIIIGEIIEITQSPKRNDASAIFHTHTVYLKKQEM